MFSAVYLVVALLLIPCSSSHQGTYNCLMKHKNVTSSVIGVLIDRSTRLGKEQEIAMKIAVQDIYMDSCIQLILHIRDSSGSSSSVTSTASNLIHNKKVEAIIIGASSSTELAATILPEVLKNSTIPIILLSPTTAILPTIPSSNLIQMTNTLSTDIQCLTSIINHFQWQKVSVIYSQDSKLLSVLSDSLKSVNSTVEQHSAFPSLSSMSDPENFIDQKLRKLSNGGRSRVFILVHLPIELATVVFRKAHQLGMLEKGFVWIISDEVASFLDSVDVSVIGSMQGVIGYKTSFLHFSGAHKRFRVRFERSYLAKHPNDQGNSNPSFFGFRAYDALQVIAKAKLHYSKTSSLLPNLMFGDFLGLTGNMSFRNGILEELPIFKIINVVGNGYQELGYWSSEDGLFSKSGRKVHKKNHKNGISFKLGTVLWPGGQKTVPKGLNLGVNKEMMRPLRIGVPASGAFHQFVNVSIDEVYNRPVVTGFAVDVFRTTLKYLPYDLPFDLVPFYGTYDELVHGVYVKGFDAAIGDINILEERYKWADFSQPYAKSGMVMVVPVKQDNKATNMWTFLMVFDTKMWVLIPSMGLFMGFVVCLIEHYNTPDFAHSSISNQISTIFWFSFSLLFFAPKESPRSNLSKIVLAPWHFLVLMLTIYYTAALTSVMTVSQLPPSVKDVDTLQRENASVGCNWNSFLCPYLVDVLQFKFDNIRPLKSSQEYHLAFQRGDIKAAFFVTSHAKLFLSNYCKGYTIAGPTYYFGGLSFAFPKGSPLSIDMSQAVVKAIERGEIKMLERDLLARYKCSASNTNNNNNTNIKTISLRPFSGLFYISGGIASAALLVTVFPTIHERWRISGTILVLIARLRAWLSMFPTN